VPLRLPACVSVGPGFASLVQGVPAIWFHVKRNERGGGALAGFT
jgi:hypothetical protein